MKFLQFRIGNGLFQILILKFGHFATFRTYHVMMGFIVVRTLVLGRIAELMFNNQFCIALFLIYLWCMQQVYLGQA